MSAPSRRVPGTASSRHRRRGRLRVARERRAHRLPGWGPFWWRTLELAVAAPQVVAHRVRLMAPGGDPRGVDGAEMLRMTWEKAQAWAECSGAVSSAFVSAWIEISAGAMGPWLRVATASPWSVGQWNALYARAAWQWARHAPRIAAVGIEPVHRRAVANARRLGAARTRARSG